VGAPTCCSRRAIPVGSTPGRVLALLTDDGDAEVDDYGLAPRRDHDVRGLMSRWTMPTAWIAPRGYCNIGEDRQSGDVNSDLAGP
jgi:hypothetical protein